MNADIDGIIASGAVSRTSYDGLFELAQALAVKVQELEKKLKKLEEAQKPKKLERQYVSR